MDISKSDWKLFRERIGDWQERHMEKLCQKYIKLLGGDAPASDKFWELDKQIRRDKNTPGVQLELRKSELVWDLVALIRDHVITADDLDGFSDEVKEAVRKLTNG